MLQELVLAAPDHDVADFNDCIGAIRKIAGRVTIYTNPRDRALALAQQVHSRERVGQRPQTILKPGVDVIDVTGIDTRFTRHS